MPDQARRTALATAIPTEPNVYQLTITLIGIQPPTWRRVLVPGALLQQRLFKTGGRLIRHARYFILRLAESYLTRHLFGQILQRIERLAWHPA
jgi:hypothetical protein